MQSPTRLQKRVTAKQLRRRMIICGGHFLGCIFTSDSAILWKTKTCYGILCRMLREHFSSMRLQSLGSIVRPCQFWHKKRNIFRETRVVLLHTGTGEFCKHDNKRASFMVLRCCSSVAHWEITETVGLKRIPNICSRATRLHNCIVLYIALVRATFVQLWGS